ncbi:hypothetical protein NDU88_007966 [Pleurodeles waltl]|uniref:Uncharacterized protein n=1 Tax=Pleurodeles waltl TaxID=8319 RepID=A0AAV7U342_PLEWA|nr:hypothetical protein NDU88_007966 [Pleurodeles waltl]
MYRGSGATSKDRAPQGGANMEKTEEKVEHEDASITAFRNFQWITPVIGGSSDDVIGDVYDNIHLNLE